MADNQPSATRGAASAARKRKRKKCDEKDEGSQPKKRCTSKAMTKKDRSNLTKSLQCLDVKILLDEIQRDVSEHFTDGKLSKFASELLESERIIVEIARHHLEAFIHLYGKCKALKNSRMEFQRQWHMYCSAFLLEERYTLADISLDVADSQNASLAGIRNEWLEYCKDHETPVPTSNPVMMTISARTYFYLLDQVAVFQKELPAANKSTEEQILSSNNDSDDVYYRFGGAAICAMLKQRYKDIKKCSPSSDTRNSLSIEICLLQAMKIKDKSDIPAYLQFRDKGCIYFPQSNLIPFFRNFDGVLKEIVNEDGFLKHGNDLIKVYYNQLALVQHYVFANVTLLFLLKVNCMHSNFVGI